MNETKVLFELEVMCGDPENPSHAWCVECNRVKSIEFFYRLASAQQTRAWGRCYLYAKRQRYGEQLPVCCVCWNKNHKPKPKRKETLPELINRLEAERVPRDVRNKRVADKQQDEKLRKSKAATLAHWKKNQKPAFDYIRKALDRERSRATRWEDRYMPFRKEYIQYLTAMLGSLSGMRMKREKAPKTVLKLQEGVHRSVWAEINAAWQSLIPFYREYLEPVWFTEQTAAPTTLTPQRKTYSGSKKPAEPTALYHKGEWVMASDAFGVLFLWRIDDVLKQKLDVTMFDRDFGFKATPASKAKSYVTGLVRGKVKIAPYVQVLQEAEALFVLSGLTKCELLRTNNEGETK